MTRGKYIVLEGPEGVGKTTQIQELARRLQVAGLPVRTLREPDSQSDLTARALRQLTQDPRYPMNTNTEVLLYNAARSQSLQVIRKSVEQGVICLVDRNYLTTLAIQYYGRGDVPDYETINRIITFAVNGVEPDLCIILDAPVQLLKERAGARGQGERFDNLDEAFLERVRAGYLWEAKQRNLPVIFATEEPDKVAGHIWKLVAETLALREPSKATTGSEPASIKAIIEQKKAAVAAGVEPPFTVTPVAADDTPEPVRALEPLEKLAKISQQKAPAYHVPAGLNAKSTEVFRRQMDVILAKRIELMQKLQTAGVAAKEAATAALPVACFEAESLLQPAADALSELASSVLSETHNAAGDEPVRLVDYWPKSELNLVADLLYPYSNEPFSQLAGHITAWPYEQKADVLEKYLRDSSTALQAARYTWDILAEYHSFVLLAQQESVRAVSQRLTPRYGFVTPEILEEAGCSEQFEACFEASLALYSELQAAGYEQQAQYATLFGHTQRFRLTMSAADLLRLQGANSVSTPLVESLPSSIGSVHPLVADAVTPKRKSSAKSSKS